MRVGFGRVVSHLPTGGIVRSPHLGGATEEPRLFEVDVVIFGVPEELERAFGAAAFEGSEGLVGIVGGHRILRLSVVVAC